jgi:SHS2 domain-containing protein
MRRSRRGFKFLEHMTDAEIEAHGKSLDEAFQNAGLATEETMVSISSIRAESKRVIKVKGKDLESLLYSWLESLITLQDTEGLLFSKFSSKVSKTADGFKLESFCYGEKFNPDRHEQKTAIKSPTYHDMKIVRGKKGVSMRFLLDL